MATTNAIEIPPVWTNLNTLTGIAVGTAMYLQNVGRPGDIVSVWQGDTEPAISDRGWSIDQIKEYYAIPPDGLDVWVKYYRADINEDLFSKTALLQVATQKPILPMRQVSPHNPVEFSGDFLLEVSKGNVPGHSMVTIIGSTPNLMEGMTQTVWDVSRSYVYLTADTTLYISSSNALDTAVTVVVTGKNDLHESIVDIVVTNGQNQVALNSQFYRVEVATVVGPNSPLGDLYIAESDTLTGGVPDDLDKVKTKIPLSGLDAGTPFASDHISHNGFATIPAGHTWYALSVQAYVEKNIDVIFSGRFRPIGGQWINRSPSPLYQNDAYQPFNQYLALPEKADFEARAIAGTGSGGSNFQFQFQFLQVENGA